MKDSLMPGLEMTRQIDVDTDRTIGFMGDECRVYGTPYLLQDIEILCRDLLLEHSDEGEDSVGTHVQLEHSAATLLGMWVEITVTITEVARRAVTFDFVARDALEQVAAGTHGRFVVDVETTAARLKGKLAKVQEI
ncbi:MAG: LysR family transcriptional regulator [Halieaceae bacterium]|jgi:fluoroacetyl-CoA thioesterase|nr:LysR family transcriptional regulator [Halieaceae bacterium]